MKKLFFILVLFMFLVNFSFSYQIDKGKELKVVTLVWVPTEESNKYEDIDDFIISSLKKIGEEKVLDTSISYLYDSSINEAAAFLTIIYQE